MRTSNDLHKHDILWRVFLVASLIVLTSASPWLRGQQQPGTVPRPHPTPDDTPATSSAYSNAVPATGPARQHTALHPPSYGPHMDGPYSLGNDGGKVHDGDDDTLTGALRGFASRLGLRFLVSFVEEVYPATLATMEDIPIAANYFYKLVKRGFSTNVIDPHGPTASSLYRILQPTLAKLLSTRTGSSLVTSFSPILNMDLSSLASAGDFSGMLAQVQESSVSSPDGGSTTRPELLSLFSLMRMINRLGSTLLNPTSVLTDVADVARTAVEYTVQDSAQLTDCPELRMRMSNEEHQTFVRVKHNLEVLQDAMKALNDNLRLFKLFSLVWSPSPSGNVINPAPFIDSPAIWDPVSSLTPPWIKDPMPAAPPHSPSPPQSDTFSPTDVLQSVLGFLNKAGVNCVARFFDVANYPVRDAARDAPAAISYLYKIASSTGAPGYTDDSYSSYGPGAASLHRIVQTTLAKLMNTDTGSWIVDLAWSSGFDLMALAGSQDFTEAMSILRSGATAETRAASLGFFLPTSPIGLVSDVVGTSLAFVDGILKESSVLRNELDSQLAMSEEVYLALVRLKMNLDSVHEALASLTDDLLGYRCRDTTSNVPTMPLPPSVYESPSAPPPSYGSPSVPPPYGLPSVPPPLYGSPSAPPSTYASPSVPPPLYGSPQHDGNTDFLDWMQSTLNQAGLEGLGRTIDVVHSAVRDIVKYIPLTIQYVWKLTQSPAILDPHGPAAASIHRILQSTIVKLLSTDAGSYYVANYAVVFNVDLAALAAAEDFGGVLDVLKSAKWYPDGYFWYYGQLSVPKTYGPQRLASYVMQLVRELANQALTPGSRISPLRLASDVAGVSLTFVEGIVRESGSLRNELDTTVAMTYAEYANFLRFQANLEKLLSGLDALNGNIQVAVSAQNSWSSYRRSLTSEPSELDSSWGPLYPSYTADPSPPSTNSPTTDFPPETGFPPETEEYGTLQWYLDALAESGVGALVHQIDAIYDRLSSTAKEAPIAANYLFNLLRSGLDSSITDPNGPAANSLYQILQPTFAKITNTKTGNLAFGYALGFNVNFYSLASAQNFTQILDALKQATWVPEGYGYPSMSPTDGPNRLIDWIFTFYQTISGYALSPGSYLKPLELASDVVGVSLTLANSIVAEEGFLKYSVNMQMAMSSEEFLAFANLQTNLMSLRGALEKLSGLLEDKVQPVQSPPPYWPPADVSSEQFEFISALQYATEQAGLGSLWQTIYSLSRVLNEMGKDLPVTADYVLKLANDGVSASMLNEDQDSPMGAAFFGILQPTFAKLVSTDTGSYLADTAANFEVNLRALGAAQDFQQVLSILGEASWWPSWWSYDDVEPTFGPRRLVLYLLSCVKDIASQTLSPDSRLTPIGLASDVVGTSFAFVNGILKESSVLRHELDSQLAMSEEVYLAFMRLEAKLNSLLAGLMVLSGDIEGLQNSHNDYNILNITASPPSWRRHMLSTAIDGPPGSVPPGLPYYPGPPSPPEGQDVHFYDWYNDKLEQAGLGSLGRTIDAIYLGMSSSAKDGPVAANYLFKLLWLGLESSDPNGPAASSLYQILQLTSAKITNTKTGNLAAFVAHPFNLNFQQLALAQDFSEMIGALQEAEWSYDYSTADEPRRLVEKVIGFLQAVTSLALSPGSYIPPLELATDVVGVSLTLADGILSQADVLRSSLDYQMMMSNQEFFAFVNLQNNLRSLRDGLEKLSGILTNLVTAGPIQSQPPYAHWPQHPSYPISPPDQPRLLTVSGVLDLVSRIADELGLGFFVSYARDVYSQLNGVAEHLPVLINYARKVLSVYVHDLGKETDIGNGSFTVISSLLESLVAKAMGTDTGSLMINEVLRTQGLDLSELARNPSELLAALKQIPLVDPRVLASAGDLSLNELPDNVKATISAIGQELSRQILGSHPRISLLGFLYDIVDFTTTTVDEVLTEADQLQALADERVRMSSKEVLAFFELRSTLEQLRGALADFAGGLDA